MNSRDRLCLRPLPPLPPPNLPPAVPAFPPAFPVDSAAADEAAVVTAFPPLPPLALAADDVAAVAAAEAVVLSATSGPIEILESIFAQEKRRGGRKGIPAATAEAARAAAASPLDPSFAATLAVVPDPVTTNLVQSSAVPR